MCLLPNVSFTGLKNLTESLMQALLLMKPPLISEFSGLASVLPWRLPSVLLGR